MKNPIAVFTSVCGWRTWPWCVLDNIAHEWFQVPLDGDFWTCRRHDTALGGTWPEDGER
ncbi:hypothetical protein [Nocardia farcinica]|uniref:Uncharacterized protein n=1 Tax=Nocardia farcinica (strain IFM 10152) TaxID=247156 RepID=Q5Z3X4_NOCFA|nr:hypothetical protein [Nocardia farcinica]BAD54867.1 hypothetical protein NFA_250 [Nocardia farcinica IFM 10152]